MEISGMFNGNSIDQSGTLAEHQLANYTEDNGDLIPDDLLGVGSRNGS